MNKLSEEMVFNMHTCFVGSNLVETLADTKKAERELGFKAGISLDEGIGKLVS